MDFERFKWNLSDEEGFGEYEGFGVDAAVPPAPADSAALEPEEDLRDLLAWEQSTRPQELELVKSLLRIPKYDDKCVGNAQAVIVSSNEKKFQEVKKLAKGFIDSGKCHLELDFLLASLESSNIIGVMYSRENICGILLAQKRYKSIYISALCAVQSGKILLKTFNDMYHDFVIHLHASPRVIGFYHTLGFKLGNCDLDSTEMDEAIERMNAIRKRNGTEDELAAEGLPLFKFIVDHELTEKQPTALFGSLRDNYSALLSGVLMSRCPDTLELDDKPRKRAKTGGKKKPKKLTRKQKRKS